MNPQRRFPIVALITAVIVLVTAGAASAAQFHVSSGSASLVSPGSVVTEIGLQGWVVKCQGGYLSGTGPAVGTSETQGYHLGFHPCTVAGLPATIETSGCTDVFDANATAWSLSCGTSKGIRFNGNSFYGTCQVEIPPQTGINGASFENMSPRTTFTVGLSSTNTKFTVLKSTGVCMLEEGSGENATYTASFGVQANKGASEIWWE